MKLRFSSGICAMTFVAAGMVAFAQATPQEPRAGAAATQQTTASEQQIMVSGCVQRESDYRRTKDAGRGGVAGTGVGAGNEFVLINASMPGSAAPGRGAVATGTAGATAAYELTGANEKQAEQYVGKRVEITGKLKAAEAEATTGRPTGGPTAGKPPEGIDVAGGDLKLRELEVASVKESSGTCPAN